MKHYNYYRIALNDFKYLQYNIEREDEDIYNRNAILCEQVVEKLLKHIVERSCFTEDYSALLKGHNLVKLYKAIVEEGIELELSINMLRTLKDYYFDANYPGDNFILLTKEEVMEAYTFTKEALDKVKQFVENN
ncbi:MAG: HEPN domain-containing protein [Cellulosilyticaceae bacterium]|uniref:HEPN domain-containing protein n=1 Tax=Niameybacter sp. TaxID=2033640 RepID=UPI002FC71073